jgi:hypothetical protein
MASIFLVVYTASGLIGAVSYPLPDMQQCDAVAKSRTEQNEDLRHPFRHPSPPRKSEEEIERRIQRRMDVLGKALANKQFGKGWYDHEAQVIRNEEYGIRMISNIPPEYTFKCEEHKSRPKVQTKIDPGDRHLCVRKT